MNEQRLLRRVWLTALLSLGMAAAVADETRPSPWSGTAALGVMYDSNLAVLDLDRRSGEGDVGLQGELGIAYTWSPPQTSIRAGYDLSQTLYADLGEFNLRLHRASIDASRDFAAATAGAMANYAHASLDGREFLVFRQLSPYLARLAGERLYLRGAYELTDKSFRDSPHRDATAHALTVDAFVFVNGLRTYLVLGARYDDERAAADHFDFRGPRLSAQLVQRVPGFDRELILRARARYEQRDYRAPDPSIDAVRRDRRYRLEGQLEIPLGERFNTTLRYEYADNRSNLPAMDLSRHGISWMLGARL